MGHPKGKPRKERDMDMTGYASVDRLATHWDVSRQTILNWIREGKLKATRLGPKVFRIKVEDAQKFEAEGVAGKIIPSPTKEVPS